MYARLVTLLITLAFASFATAADVLHRREINQKNPGGKDLVMTFEEIRRDEKTSTAKVTFVSGAAMHSSLFVMRGFYDIAQARRAPYFIQLKEWEGKDGAWMYLVGFSHDKGVDPKKYFDLTDLVPTGSKHEFETAADFDTVFKPR